MMSMKFGMDWKKHDAKRVMGIMLAGMAAEEAAVPKKKKSNADGRDTFR